MQNKSRDISKDADDCNDLLMEYIEDLLDAPGKEKIERHLKECPQCRKALDDSRAIRDRLINHSDFLYFVRNTLSEAMADQASAVEKLGQEKINGLDAIGFQLRSEKEREKIVIWADATTAMPIQIDLHLDASVYTLRNIEFEIPADGSLVSMELPDGYARQEQEINMTEFSEADFLTVLRIYAKYMRDGSYPDKLAFEDLLKLVPDLGKTVPRMDLKPEEMREIGNVFARGMMFLQNLTATGAESHYAGRGVRFGDGTKEVFRYRMSDSPSWRVIYGDLQVKEIAAHASAR